MKYITYWSVLDTPSQTIKSDAIALGVAIIAGILWILIKKFKKDQGDGDKSILLWGTGIFAICGLLMFLILTYNYQRHSDSGVSKIFHSPGVEKIEGFVSNFHRVQRNAKYGSETIETFSVDSIQFAYSNAAFGKFFSFSETNNKVVYNGQAVRITYKQDEVYLYGERFKTILKLEIGR